MVSDGELSKTSFQYYVTDRLGGLEPITPKPGVRATRENRAFPAFYKDGSHSGTQSTRYACTGPLKYVGQKQLDADIANLKAGLKGASPVDVFMPSVSPSSCVGLMENRHYRDEDEHLYAVAEALREEYQAIVAAGFIVQIDDPRLAMNYMLNPEPTVEQHRAWAAKRIAALNHALRGIPPERVRHHTCYGINMGPRTSDFELKHLADLIVTINAGYYSFEMANPRHEHEWRVWENVKLPGRQGPDAGMHHPCLGDRRASGAGGRAHRAAREHGRPRARDGERGLRLCIDDVGRRAAGDRARDRLGQVRKPGRRRPARQPRAVEVIEPVLPALNKRLSWPGSSRPSTLSFVEKARRGCPRQARA